MDDIKVVIAVRVSSDEQFKNGYSHSQQLRELPLLVAEQGWSIAERSEGRGLAIYDEGAASSQIVGDEDSSLAHRPVMLDLLNELEHTKPTYVVCLAKDRMFRDTYEYTSFARTIMRAGVHGIAEWSSLSGAPSIVRLDDAEQRAFAEIQAVVASLETAIRKRRVALGRKEHSAKGLPNGGRVPFGYRWGGKKQPHAVHAVDRETYLLMVELAFEGKGGAAIATALRNGGRETQAGRLNWTACSVRRILASQAQLGRIPAPGAERKDGLATEWVQGTGMKALITEERWLEMRSIVESRSRNAGHGNRRRHALAGLLVCPSCGHTLKMRPDRRTVGGEIRTYFNYECRKSSSGCEAGVSIAEGRALEELHTLVAERLERTVWTCEVPTEADPEVEALQERLDAATQALAAAQRRHQRARHAYENVEDELAQEEFERVRAHQRAIREATADVERLSAALRVRAQAPPAAEVDELRAVLSGWREFTADEKREMLETMITRATVMPKRAGRRLLVEWR